MPSNKNNKALLAKSYFNKEEISRGNPTYLIIEPTNICNLSCIMCPYSIMVRPKQNMPLSLYKKIISEAKESVDFLWLHLYSEPLLCKDIYEMIDIAEKAGIRVGLSTNVTTLTERNAKRLLETRLTLLILAIDGHTKNTYEKIRVGADFNKVKKNAERFSVLRSKSNNTRLQAVIQIINMPINQHEINEFKSHWEGNGFDNVCVKGFHNFAGQEESINNLKETYYIPTEMRGKVCFEPWVGMTILSNGHVVPCCNDYDGKQILGDTNHQSLLSIWNGQKMKDFRNIFIKKLDRSNTICEKCDTPCIDTNSISYDNNPFDPEIHQISLYRYS